MNKPVACLYYHSLGGTPLLIDRGLFVRGWHYTGWFIGIPLLDYHNPQYIG